MKVYSLLVFIAIFIGINSSIGGFSTGKKCTDYQKNDQEDKQAYSKDFCKTLQYDSDKKCCYIKYKKSDKYYFNCHELTSEQFWNIKDTKKTLETEYYEKIKNIVCDSSSFLKSSFLLILLFLF